MVESFHYRDKGCDGMAFFDRFRPWDIDENLKRFRETPGAVLLDVREEDEFAAGHIPGSVNLPLSAIETAETLLPDYDTPIFAYCLAGTRSTQAAVLLREQGYEKAISIGGIERYHGELVKDT